MYFLHVHIFPQFIFCVIYMIMINIEITTDTHRALYIVKMYCKKCRIFIFTHLRFKKLELYIER